MAFDPSQYTFVDNPYGTSKGGPSKAAYAGNGQYIDEQGNYWGGTWENPVSLGPNGGSPQTPPPPSPSPTPQTSQNPGIQGSPAPAPAPGPQTSQSQNPGIQSAGQPFTNTAPPSAPPPPGFPTGDPIPAPRTASDPALVKRWIQQWAAFNPNHDPSIDNDIDYWVSRISETSGSGPIDWNYWNSRFLQNAPGGTGGTGTGGGNGSYNGGWGGDPGFQGIDPNSTGSFDQALQIANSYAQHYLGRNLTDAEVNAFVQRYSGGGQRQDYQGSGLNNVLKDIYNMRAGAGGGGGNSGVQHSNNPGITGTGAPGQGGSGTSGTFNDQVRQVLLSRLSTLSQPLDANDPTIKAEMDAAQQQADRQQQTERSQLAERLYAQGGLNTDALNQGIQQSNERIGTGLATLRGTLMQKMYEQRAQELAQSLALAVQSGDTQDAQQIQLQLAALQAQLTREGLGVNLSEFQAWLNAQINQFLGGSSLGA